MRFVKISNVHAGDQVQFGRGFDCIEVGGVREVKVNPDAASDAKRFGTFTDHHRFFVDCNCGRHLLESQVDFKGDGDSLIGVYAVGTITAAQIADKKNPLPNFHAQVRKIAAHVHHSENWVNLGKLVKRPGGEYELGLMANG